MKYPVRHFQQGEEVTAGEYEETHNLVRSIQPGSPNVQVEYTSGVVLILVDQHEDERVKADSGDPEPGFLDAKVQRSIEVDPSGHALQLVGDADSPGADLVYGTDDTDRKSTRLNSSH